MMMNQQGQLPPYCETVLPQKYKILFTMMNSNSNKNEIFQFLLRIQNEKKIKKKKIEYKSKIYIPKYNIFEKSENFDYHVEKGDENFEKANKIVNIMRSRGLNSEFCLNFDQIENFFKNNPNFNSIALYNYANIENWNDDEISDISAQLCGEEENLLLVYENLFKEIDYQLNLKKENDIDLIEEIEDISIFQNEYLIFLKSIEYFLSENEKNLNEYFPTCILKPSKINPITYEWIGYLSEIYFIPWKFYNSFEDFEKMKFPLQILSEGYTEEERIKNQNLWKNKIDLRKKGLILMSKNEELIKMNIEELEIFNGKKQNFYELERIKYSLNRNEREEKEKSIFSLLENYSKKKEKRNQIFEFCNNLSKFL